MIQCSALKIMIGMILFNLVMTTTIIKVKVEPKKLHYHPLFGEGFTYGYSLNNRQGVSMTLKIGHEYVFDLTSVSCEFPFVITSNNPQIPNELIAISNIGCKFNNTMIKFTPTKDMNELFYASTSHPKMGGTFKIQQESFCDKYARIQKKSGMEFITAVCLSTFDALATSEPHMLGFFTGHKGPTNYFTDLPGLQKLQTRLVKYFGHYYGCTDKSLPTFDGPNMEKAHAALPIGKIHFKGFIDALIQAMKIQHVSEQDRIDARKGLEDYFYGEGVPYGVCNSYDCRSSICDRLSDKHEVSNRKFLEIVLKKLIKQLQHHTVLSHILHDYVNHDQSNKPYENFMERLIALYGHADVMSCTDENFPTSGVNIRFKGNNLQQFKVKSPPGWTFIHNSLLHAQVLNILETMGLKRSESFMIRSSLKNFTIFHDQNQVVLNFIAIDETDSCNLRLSNHKSDTIEVEIGTELQISSTASCQCPIILVDISSKSRIDKNQLNEQHLSNTWTEDYTRICNQYNTLYWFPQQDEVDKKYGIISAYHPNKEPYLTIHVKPSKPKDTIQNKTEL